MYEPARNSRPTDPAAKDGYGIGDDHDLIVLTPDAPLTEVRQNNVGWNCHDTYWNSTADRNIYNCTGNQSRCDSEGPVLFKVPMPRDFVVLADGGKIVTLSRLVAHSISLTRKASRLQATTAWPR